MTRAAAFLATALLALSLPAQAACEGPLRELGLLASVGAGAESARAYRALPATCRTALHELAPGKVLPDGADTAAILALGQALNQRQIALSSDQTYNQLAKAAIPDVNLNALQGLGPDNAFQALSGMALDIASAGMASRQRWNESHLLGKMAREMRGTERHWSQYGNPGVAGAGASGSDGETTAAGSNAVTALPLPTAAIQTASCQGTLSFLEPQMRSYSAPWLSQTRMELVSLRIQDALAEARRTIPDKQKVIAEYRKSAQAYLKEAQVAANAAENTDGYGNVAVPQALEDRLPLDYSCGDGSAVHAASICALVMMRWQALALESMAELTARCWD